MRTRWYVVLGCLLGLGLVVGECALLGRRSPQRQVVSQVRVTCRMPDGAIVTFTGVRDLADPDSPLHHGRCIFDMTPDGIALEDILEQYLKGESLSRFRQPPR